MSLGKSLLLLPTLSIVACSLISAPDDVKLVPDEGSTAGMTSSAAGMTSSTAGSSVVPGGSGNGGGNNSGDGGAAGAEMCQGTDCGSAGVGDPVQICLPNTPSCQGNVATSCNDAGTAYLPGTPCSATQTCVSGACEDHECEPLEEFCSAEVVRVCAADGLSSTELQACGAGEYCDVLMATCQTGTCAPNEPACDGSRATTCNANGSGYVAGGMSCAGSTTCDAGDCTQHVCAPATNYCVGSSVRSCAANGLSSTNLQDCNADQYCDTASATCKDQVCQPSTSTCDGQTLVKCNSTGSTSTRTPCSGGTPVCSANTGSCIPCGTGTQFCSTQCVSINDDNHCGSCNSACANNQACTNGDCRTRDGYDCVVAADCVSNQCSTFYVDADGDLHGSAASPKKVCGSAPPAGHVTSNDDCCDVGGDAANIFPGQPRFFTSQATSCNKGWDYNCSNNAEKEGNLLMSDCVPNIVGKCPAGTGWGGTTIPACGGSGSKQLCIDPGNGSFCASTMPASGLQGCH